MLGALQNLLQAEPCLWGPCTDKIGSLLGPDFISKVTLARQAHRVGLWPMYLQLPCTEIEENTSTELSRISIFRFGIS